MCLGFCNKVPSCFDRNGSQISQILAVIVITLKMRWVQEFGINIFYPFAHVLGCLTGVFLLQLCMLCSVGYHLFCCHRSEKTSRRWMALDYAGVSIGILGCYVPGVFYTFYCNNVSSARRFTVRPSLVLFLSNKGLSRKILRIPSCTIRANYWNK